MKTISLNAPKSIALHKMPEAEIASFVEKESEKILAAMPKDTRPVGINMVSLNQRMDLGGWVEWTRACCAQRHLIDDFVDPVMRDYGIGDGSGAGKLLDTHAESQLRIINLESKSHVK